jgi:hypothetical protein
VLVLALPVTVLAVDDLGLLRVKLQTAFRQTCPNRRPAVSFDLAKDKAERNFPADVPAWEYAGTSRDRSYLAQWKDTAAASICSAAALLLAWTITSSAYRSNWTSG